MQKKNIPKIDLWLSQSGRQSFHVLIITSNKLVLKGNTIWLPRTTLKTGQRGVMLKAIKKLSVSSSSPIGFEVKWHSLRSDKWYQSHGHGFKSRECHYEGGIVRGTTIWLPTTTLKQRNQFRIVPANTAGIYRTGQCTSIGTPSVSYRKKYRPYWTRTGHTGRVPEKSICFNR